MTTSPGDGPDIHVMRRCVTPVQMSTVLPGSKSVTNRALMLAALGNATEDQPCVLRQPLRSDDTDAFTTALQALGGFVSESDDGDGNASNTNAAFPSVAPSFTVAALHNNVYGNVSCRDAGTVARFLPPALHVLGGDVHIDASAQMRARPMGELVRALRTCGAHISAENLPFSITSDGWDGGTVHISGKVSSQFLSGLLMAAPLARHAVEIVCDELVSKPYVDMTMKMMALFGRSVEMTEPYRRFVVTSLGRYETREFSYDIEADASTASYFFAAAAVTGSTVEVRNLRRNCLQGDADFVDILRDMGAEVTDSGSGVRVHGTGMLHGIDVDMGDISDVFMTLACIAPFADDTVRIRNIAQARVKESDRIAAVEKGLLSLGVRVETTHDAMTIYPMREIGEWKPAIIDTVRDHRIAMSFAVLGLAAPHDGSVTIDNPGCVRKTCPDFFARIAAFEHAPGDGA